MIAAEMLSSKLIGQGLAASAGAASGALAFTCDEAEEYKKNNVKCILCRFLNCAIPFTFQTKYLSSLQGWKLLPMILGG